jgi:hypothetical protein
LEFKRETILYVFLRRDAGDGIAGRGSTDALGRSRRIATGV